MYIYIYIYDNINKIATVLFEKTKATISLSSYLIGS